MKLGSIGAAGGAALVALSLVLTPAIAASNQDKPKKRPVPSLRSGSFTPAVADPRLAAEMARRGLQANSFRFTPSSVAGNQEKSVRVAVRARASTAAQAVRTAATDLSSATPVTAVTPTAYNLGVSVGWKGFALTGDVSRVDSGVAPGGREQAEASVSYRQKRFSGRLEVGAVRSTGTQPRLIAEDETYTVGVGGSFSLARNLDVTGGVRYKIHRDRLETLADDRQDSQAVYIGTAFKF
ncbi:MAG: porin [Allosphingosinicella sp.]